MKLGLLLACVVGSTLCTAQEVRVPPTAYAIELGKYVSGNLASLEHIDGNALRAQRFFVPNDLAPQPRIRAIAPCPYPVIGSLRVRVTLRQVTGGVFTHTFAERAFNSSSQTYYENRSEREPIGLDYRTLEWTPPGDPNQYVLPDGTLLMKTEINRGVAPLGEHFYRIEWDQVEFVVTPG